MHKGFPRKNIERPAIRGFPGICAKPDNRHFRTVFWTPACAGVTGEVGFFRSSIPKFRGHHTQPAGSKGRVPYALT